MKYKYSTSTVLPLSSVCTSSGRVDRGPTEFSAIHNRAWKLPFRPMMERKKRESGEEDEMEGIGGRKGWKRGRKGGRM